MLQLTSRKNKPKQTLSDKHRGKCKGLMSGRSLVQFMKQKISQTTQNLSRWGQIIAEDPGIIGSDWIVYNLETKARVFILNARRIR